WIERSRWRTGVPQVFLTTVVLKPSLGDAGRVSDDATKVSLAVQAGPQDCKSFVEFVMAATHKHRSVNARVSTAGDDKSVNLAFDSESVTPTPTNGTATIKLAGFAGFTPASRGFFLIPDTGVSLYVPRATINPSDSYS